MTIARPKPPLRNQVPGPPSPNRRWRKPSVANAQVSRLSPRSNRNATRRATGTWMSASTFEKPTVGLSVYLLRAIVCV